MENSDIAKIFSNIADLLEIKGENPFRVRSYRNAALAIKGLPITIKTIVERDEKELEEIPGIGKGLHEKIIEIFKTGRCSFLDELLRELPRGLLDLLDISGLGPKKVRVIYENLNIESLDGLEKAAKDGIIRTLPGMGQKTEKNILKAISAARKRSGRFGIAVAADYAEELINCLKGTPGVLDACPAGSLRRWRETVGDLDILVACRGKTGVMDCFASHPDVEAIVAKGKTKTTVIVKNGMQVDIRVINEESFGAALQYFTGSKVHNVALRNRSKRKGLKISEYGVFREHDGRYVAGRSEEEVYRSVGLDWIPPELRENKGEIEAAEKGKLPGLLEAGDIKGDLHIHTRESDGRDTIEEMAGHAMGLGYEYIAVTDHSKAVGIAHGLNEKRLLRQMEEIERINSIFKAQNLKFRILKGTEVDIRIDGSLDLDTDVLKRLDIVVAAIHSGFSMSEEKMTSRIIKAIASGMVDALAHPTGRLIDKREPYAIDMQEVLKAAKEYNVAMEINSHPARLDLNDSHCRLAKDIGVRLMVSTDSHSRAQMTNMRFGVHTARRGWLEKGDVLNAMPLKKLFEWLGRG